MLSTRPDLTLWPCSTCGADGVRNLGTEGYCTTQLSIFLRSLPPELFRLDGVLVADGCLRPDHGPAFAECVCVGCGATLVAVVGSPCPYCAAARERMQRWQAELVLTPPEVDPADARYRTAVETWARQIAHAVKAGLIDEDEARRVLGRWETRHAA